MRIRVLQLDGRPCTTLGGDRAQRVPRRRRVPGRSTWSRWRRSQDRSAASGSATRPRARACTTIGARARRTQHTLTARSTTSGEPMSATTTAATENRALLDWVAEWQEILTPDRVVWCERLRGRAPAARRRARARPARSPSSTRELRPDSFLARSDPRDVARVEERTYIASDDDPGPTNNWREPDGAARGAARALPGRDARPHDVRGPVLDGRRSARRRRGSASSSPTPPTRPRA